MKTYHSLRSRRRSHPRMQLCMAPMIDVVFLLLVFFLLAANFRSREGFLPTEIPQQTSNAELMEMEPLSLLLTSLPDGSCQIQIGSARTITIASQSPQTDFTMLSQQLLEVLNEHGRNLDDAVKIIPDSKTKWDHVVKTYDALWQINLRNIIFTMVD